MLPNTDTTTTTPIASPVKLPTTIPTTTPAVTTPTPTSASTQTSQPQSPSAPVQMTRAQYQAKYGQPPPASPLSTSAPVKMTTAQYQAKYGTNPDGSVLTNDQKTVASAKAQPNPVGKAVIGAGGAAQDTLDAVTGNSGTPFDYINPVGWVAKLFGAATQAAGSGVNALANVTTKPIGSFLGTKLRGAVGADNVDKFVNHPITQALVKEYSTDPDIAAALGAVNSIASLAGTITGGAEAVKGLGALSESVAPLAKDLSENASTQSLMGKNPADVTGRITQTTAPEDITTAKRGLSTVDMSGVKTYEQGVKVLNDQIEANTSKVDTSFGKSNEKYTSGDLTKEIAQQGGRSPITSDPVGDGLRQLSEYYKQTNDPTNLARINNVLDEYNHDGITAKQINDIAREHGEALNAYNKSGDLAASMKAQEAENTRTSMKEVARDLMPDENTRAVDKNTADLIKTRNMFKDMAEKVQQLENKVRETGFLTKAGTAFGKVLDFTSGGFLRGMLRTLQGFSGSGSALNALDLQRALQGNLELLDRLNGMTPVQLTEVLKNPSMLALPAGPTGAPSGVSLPAISDRSMVPTVIDKPAKIQNYQSIQPLALPPGGTPSVYPEPIALPARNLGNLDTQSPINNYDPGPQNIRNPKTGRVMKNPTFLPPTK